METNDIDRLTIIATREARILYCVNEIQKLTTYLKESFIELQEVQPYQSFNEQIGKCIDELDYWIDPLITCLCYEKSDPSKDAIDDNNNKVMMDMTKNEKPN